MATVRTTPPRPQPVDEGIPPLEQGDHLDQKTFHARYEAMPEHVRAELVQGVVYMTGATGTHAGDIHGESSPG